MSLSNSQVTRGSVTQSQTESMDNLQTYELDWIIPNFKDISNNKSILEIRSPKSTTKSQPVKFDLKLQFVGVERRTVEMYYLSTNSEHFKSVLVKILSHCSHREVTKKECEFVQANKWQYLTHLSEDVNNDSVKNIRLLQNGSIHLKFKFVVTIKLDTVSKTIDRLLASGSQTPENHLSASQPLATQLIKDLENLFNDTTYSDVVIKSADDKEFKVHKGLLATRSPVLKALFKHNFTESSTNIAESHLESTVLCEVLYFIYTDTAPKLDEFPEKLLVAADFYQLDGLKNLCADVLQKKLNVDNAIEILQLADLHSSQKLKLLTLEFIKNKHRLVIETEGWTKLQSADLIKEVFNYCT